MSYRKGKPILLNRGRNRTKRPKTFSTEESAKEYAKKQGLNSYKIVNLKLSNEGKAKFKVVTE